MREEYDFSAAVKNPHAKRLKRQITIRIDEPTLAYFEGLAGETGVPYQTLINLYLRECASNEMKLRFTPQLTPAAQPPPPKRKKR